MVDEELSVNLQPSRYFKLQIQLELRNFHEKLEIPLSIPDQVPPGTKTTPHLINKSSVLNKNKNVKR
jgi:hypothetical protein